jgi:hypothetical protein
MKLQINVSAKGELKTNADPSDREHRIGINSNKTVDDKLEKNLQNAKTQQNKQTPCTKFKAQSSNECTLEKSDSETLTIGDYEVGVFHAQGKREAQEDRHLATSLSLKLQNKETYPIELFGIFDGHGGWEASEYVSKNLQSELEKQLNIRWESLGCKCRRFSNDFRRF